MTAKVEHELLAKILALQSAGVWPKRVNEPEIVQWLAGFGRAADSASRGRLHAIYLLSKFMYFGDPEIRAMLRALFRDKFKYPIVATFRRDTNGVKDSGIIGAFFDAVLSRTRFVGVGSPAESGTHLLYFYRQENQLSKSHFVNTHQILNLTASPLSIANPAVSRYVFIDDFCGSGKQAVEYCRPIVSAMRQAVGGPPRMCVSYHCLVATKGGLEAVRRSGLFDDVACVLELDESFRAFSDTSRFFRSPPDGIEKAFAHKLAHVFGLQLQPDAPLGFDDCQLMIGFAYNTPDNSLPVFWHRGTVALPWAPVFRRYTKF